MRFLTFLLILLLAGCQLQKPPKKKHPKPGGRYYRATPYHRAGRFI